MTAYFTVGFCPSALLDFQQRLMNPHYKSVFASELDRASLSSTYNTYQCTPAIYCPWL